MTVATILRQGELLLILLHGKILLMIVYFCLMFWEPVLSCLPTLVNTGFLAMLLMSTNILLFTRKYKNCSKKGLL